MHTREIIFLLMKHNFDDIHFSALPWIGDLGGVWVSFSKTMKVKKSKYNSFRPTQFCELILNIILIRTKSLTSPMENMANST
jgi:hypothetical protein